MKLYYPPKTDNPLLDAWLERLVKELEPLLNIYAKGDLPYASAINILAALAIGTANKKLFVNAAGDLPEWASGIKVASYTRDMAAGSGSVAYAGINFKPSAIILLCIIDSVDNIWSFSLGFSDLTLNVSISQHVFEFPVVFSSDSYVVNFLLTDDDYQRASVASFNSDGFNLAWTKVGSPTGTLKIKCLAIR